MKKSLTLGIVAAMALAFSLQGNVRIRYGK